MRADWLYVTTLSGSMKSLDALFSQAKQAGMKICLTLAKRISHAARAGGLLEDVDVYNYCRKR